MEYSVLGENFPEDDLVSVILPVFNGEKYLEKAVKSVLSQDYTNIDLIAIDDGSSDRSLDILEKLARQDPRMRVVSRPNKGLIATLNEGIGLAKGDLVARMDADDVAYPSRISAQVEAFRKRPDLALCGSYYSIINQFERLQPIVNVPFCDGANLQVLSWFFCMLKHPTVMFRRSTLGEDILYYDADYPFAEDFDLFRRIAAVRETYLIPTPLLGYRIHDQSVSVLNARKQREVHLRIMQENFDAIGARFDLVALYPILESPTDRCVGLAAQTIRDMEAFCGTLPAHLRPAFTEGVQNFFFFLFGILRDIGTARQLYSYVRACGRLDEIRRTDRLTLQLLSRFDSLALGLLRIFESAHFGLGALRGKRLAGAYGRGGEP